MTTPSSALDAARAALEAHCDTSPVTAGIPIWEQLAAVRRWTEELNRLSAEYDTARRAAGQEADSDGAQDG